MAGEIKILSEEQFDILTNDIAQFIGQIEKLRENFDAEKLKQEIVSELKLTLSQNSLFESLERESHDLELNLIALKNVRKEFIECKNESETRLVGGIVGGMFTGAITSTLLMYFFGFFA